MNKKIYLAMVFEEWKNIKAHLGNGLSFPVEIPQSGIGYMPIYDSLEKLKKDHPNCKALELEQK